jgi:predicted ArsR family transcriptional regulator
VLRALELLAAPATLAAVCAATSLHPNTVREHLEALERDGLVRRAKAEPRGRGRPAWEYSVVPGGQDPLVREYAGLAATLAAALRRHSRRPREDSVDAGRAWGAELAAGASPPEGPAAVARRRAVVALLDRLRFSPTTGPQARTVRLTRCPLLGVAEQYPDVVCSIHRGLVEGALDRWGDRTTRVQLVPFAEPGACTLTMTTAAAATVAGG